MVFMQSIAYGGFLPSHDPFSFTYSQNLLTILDPQYLEEDS